MVWIILITGCYVNEIVNSVSDGRRMFRNERLFKVQLLPVGKSPNKEQSFPPLCNTEVGSIKDKGLCFISCDL